MRSDYPQCYSRVRTYEGGNDDDPHDPGGRTSRGVIQREYNRYRQSKGLATRDVWSASEDEIADIYKKNYWDTLNGDNLPAGLDETIFDYGVNSGVSRSGKVLRRYLGLPSNSFSVDQTVLNEVAKRDVNKLIDAVNDERLRFLQGLSTWVYYGKGWSRRVKDCKAFSHALAAQTTTPPLPVPAPGKGKVPAPTNTKSATTTAGGAATAGTVAHYIDHPVKMILIVIAITAITVGIVYLINKWHKSSQDAPTPNLVPVPVKEATNVEQNH